MMDIGVDSLKVEGRMKSIHYIATVVSVYRKVIDAYAEDPDNFKIKPEWLTELEKCANRDTASAFIEGTPGYEEQMFGQQNKKNSAYDFVDWFWLMMKQLSLLRFNSGTNLNLETK